MLFIASNLSEAEFDADIGCNLNLTLIRIYKFLTKTVVTTTAMMVTIKIELKTCLINIFSLEWVIYS